MTSENAKNFFLVIEGLDGSGKSEISRALKHTLQQTHHKNVELTFEPHDPSIAGLFIRQVLTRRITTKVSTRKLALAFALNRVDHNDRVIRRFLKAQGRLIICDRYYLSSLVYQTDTTMPMKDVMVFNKGALQPDLTIFLNASTKTCYERMRRRPENKELFEEKLSKTRQKYFEAIEFLRGRGETIEEVNADGSKEEVLNAIIDILRKYGPNWLTIQRPLLELSTDVFSLNDVTQTELEAKTSSIINHFSERWAEIGNIKYMSRLKAEIVEVIDRLSYDDLGLLFMGYLRRAGYQFIDQLKWTETCAYEMEIDMPLGMKQRGTALLLARTQRYDHITKKIQLLLDQTPDYAAMRQLSDFMFVLDADSSSSVDSYYDRDASSEKISPSVRIIHRQDIATLIFQDVSGAYSADEQDNEDNTVDAAQAEDQTQYYWTLPLDQLSK
jgi:dTMP kinase